MVRVTLTKKQLATKAGSDLLQLLKHTTADGVVDEGEIAALRSWLSENSEDADFPGAAWLRELVAVILEDGVITKEERHELLLAIERVLPPEDRAIAKLRRQEAKRKAKEAAATRWEDEPATERQLSYMEFLGIDCDPEGLTKGDASKLITARTDSDKPSNRQLMILRFWDKEELAHQGRVATSDWMDAWYAEDPIHLRAWELWKSENNDEGKQSDPSIVPVGAGFDYLKRVAGGTSSKRKSGCLVALVAAIGSAAAIATIASTLAQ